MSYLLLVLGHFTLSPLLSETDLSDGWQGESS